MDLTASMIDINFWVLFTAILAIQDHADASAGIDHFIVSGDNFTVILTNHVALGPFKLPVAAFNFRGPWQSNAAYNVNDVFTHGGAVYLVIWPVPNSGATFFVFSNDGNGHNFYATLLATPPNELPLDGAPGSFLQMSLLDSPGSTVWTNLTRNIAIYLETPPDPDEIVFRYVFTETTTFPESLVGSQGSVGHGPTVGQSYELFQGNSNIGSVNVAPSPGDQVTFTFPHAITFQPGDVLSCVAPAIPDPHMLFIAFTLVGTLP